MTTSINTRTRNSPNVYLLDDTEAIIIIAMEYIRAHECEHRHDVVQNRLRGNKGKAGDEQERLVEGLWTLRCWREIVS
jgi:hypothetical protein